MNPTPPIGPARQRVLFWVFLAALLALALPLVGVVSWYVAGRIGDARQVRLLEGQARAKGEPLAISELMASLPPVPEAENAALALIEIWSREDPEYWKAILSDKPPVPEKTPRRYDAHLPYLGKEGKVARGEPLSEETIAAARKFLEENRERMNAVRAALRKPKARFPVRYFDAFSAFYAHLAPLKQEAQYFKIESLLAAVEGRVDQSIASLGDSVAVGNLLKDEPALISHLVRIAILATSLDGVQELLSRQQLSREQLGRLEAVCQRAGADGGLRRAMLGERVFGLSVFGLSGKRLVELSSMDGNPATSPFQSRGYEMAMKLMKWLGLQAADRRCMMEVMGEMVALAGVEPPESVERAEALERSLHKRFRSFPPPILSRLLLPAISKSALKYATLEAQKRCALAAAAIERYRLDHNGALPANLAALTPQYLQEIPRDPYDGQPLRFAPRPKGYVVYSVGADREDDDGQRRIPGQGSARYDEVFVVAR